MPNEQEPEQVPEQSGSDVLKLPALTPPTSPLPKKAKSTGEKIDHSHVRYEVVRMLLDGMSYAEISEVLRSLYHFSAREITLAAFKRNYYPYYKDFVDRLDKARHAHLVARITDEMKSAAKGMVHEVFELQNLLVILDERISIVRELPAASRTSSYEKNLIDMVLAKTRILERVTKITGSSGLEEKLKDMVRRTALSAQKTLIQYLDASQREKAFSLFEQELQELLESIDSGLETTPPPKVQ